MFLVQAAFFFAMLFHCEFVKQQKWNQFWNSMALWVRCERWNHLHTAAAEYKLFQIDHIHTNRGLMSVAAYFLIDYNYLSIQQGKNNEIWIGDLWYYLHMVWNLDTSLLLALVYLLPLLESCCMLYVKALCTWWKVLRGYI